MPNACSKNKVLEGSGVKWKGGLFQKVNNGSSKKAQRPLGNKDLADIHYPKELFHYKKETKIQAILYFLG